MGRKLNVVVLMGGPSTEHDVSLSTGRVILNSLDKDRYNITPAIITKGKQWLLPPATIHILDAKKDQTQKNLIALKTGQAIDKIKTDTHADVVLIAMHGAYGEDGAIQGLLELTGIPYTGSGVLASALAMDKIRSLELFQLHGLDVPKQLNFEDSEWIQNKTELTRKIQAMLRLPCFIKPRDGGSSVGITMVNDGKNLERAIELAFSATHDVIAQEYIAGREVTCAVLDEGGDIRPIALPPTEIIPKTARFFDYDAKYTPGATEEITPPRLPKKIIKHIQTIALKAHEILGCSGMSRTDMMVKRDKIYVLETNTIPGMTETSLLPQAAAAAGISFPKLLDKIIDSAINKN